ncbi:DUF6763 family protein [Teredinibacter haidensis]|uniref:DUF6763 family protein n=1 Tax=Teredinibacter haidensis TaxID=2731755 RepID=UPI0009489C17|nr:DUF6763 family protein [Teredinibacter haidensis]
MAKIFPIIGSWFQDTSSMQLFEIVAVDEDSSTIEVQYKDGDIDEFELESWGQLNLLSAAAPEDANAGYGSSYSDTWEDSPDHFNSNYNNPLEMIEPESFTGFDDLP